VISYAGVYLPLATEEVALWVGRTIDPADAGETTRRDWPGRHLEGLTWPERPPRRPVRLNTLRWPVGASAWAQGWFLCCEDDLQTIRSATLFGSSVPVTAPLVLTEDRPNPDGTRTTVATVSTALYCLPPRPLAQIPGLPAPLRQLYLLSLVDVRFFWWKRLVTNQFGPATTWEGLYQGIAAALAVTITVDAIPAAYGRPDNHSDLNQTYQAAPLVLDAVAYNCGQRIVRGLDGTVRAQNYATARAKNLSNRTLSNTPQAGGAFGWNLPVAV